MEPIRLGLIGLGAWGRRYVSTIAALKDIVLARTATRQWRELIAAGDVDGVIVATPPGSHAEMATAAIEAKLPVLIEKPLTQNAAEARELLKLAQKESALVMVEHTYLFHPAYAELKKRAGTLGAIRSIRSIGGNLGPFREATPPLWDYGPHDLSLCLDLIGQAPQSAKATKLESSPEGENWRLDLAFKKGVTAEIVLGNIFKARQRRFEAVFEKGALFFDDVKRLPEPFPAALPLGCAVESFSAAIRSKSKDLGGLKLGVLIVEILEGLI